MLQYNVRTIQSKLLTETCYLTRTISKKETNPKLKEAASPTLHSAPRRLYDTYQTSLGRCRVCSISNRNRNLEYKSPDTYSYFCSQIKCPGTRQSNPITGLEWRRGFQEVKVPRFHDNGRGRW